MAKVTIHQPWLPEDEYVTVGGVGRFKNMTTTEVPELEEDLFLYPPVETAQDNSNGWGDSTPTVVEQELPVGEVKEPAQAADKEDPNG